MEENNRRTDEQVAVTKPDVEHNLTRILKLIKSGGQGKKGKIQKDAKKEAELVGLVEEFYQRYRSLHSLYDHLKRDSKARVIPARTEREKPSSSTPSSDSEYFSSEEVNSNNSGLDGNDQTADKSSKQEVETQNCEEIRDLKLEVNSLRNLRIELERQLAERNQELESTRREKDELDQRKNHEVSAILRLVEGLKDEVSEKTKEAQREQEDKAGFLSRITELEMEVEFLLDQKNESVEKLKEISKLKEEEKLTEEQRKQEEKEGFLARITELEMQVESLLEQRNKSEKKLNEINKLKEEEESMAEQRKHEEKEGFLIRITELQMEESLLEQRNKSEDKLDQINILKEEEESVAEQRKQGEKEGFLARITELEMQVESLLEQRNKTEEKLDEINRLKEEEKITEENRKQEEKERFLARITELELEVESLLDQRRKSEEKLGEINRHKEKETEKLQKKNSELERLLTNKGDELSSLRKSYSSKEVEASTQIAQLVKHVQSLKEVLDSLEDRKRKEKQEFSQRICQVENEKTKLNSKISDQQKKLKEQEETIDKLRKESKESKTFVAERKMAEMAEEFRKKVEANIRILYQRILVAEQLQAETKNSYRTRDISHEQEIQALLKKFIPEMGEKMDQTAYNFEEQTGKILTQISRSSNVLQTAKCRISELKNELNHLGAVLNEKEEQELQLREKVWKLEASVSKEGGEKLNLMNDIAKQERKVVELEKKVREKEEGMSRVAEEKREAIRQLCIFIDYHRSSYNQLRQVFLKNNLKK